MKLTQKYMIAALVILLSFSFTFTHSASAQNTITVLLNGKTLSFDENPRIENGTTLVPMRKIFESLGATIAYDAKTKTVHASKEGTAVTLPIGSQYPLVNGIKKEIDVPGKIVNGRTLVPLRFVSESLGASVNWNQATQTITINSATTSKFSVIKIY